MKSEQFNMVSPPDELTIKEVVSPVLVEPLVCPKPNLGDRFEFLSIIGSGGMGTVYKVKERSTQEIFAVKVLQDELARDQVALKRFEQEVLSTAKLSHANLVSVYEYSTTPDGSPYMLMEYIAGQSLAARLQQSGPVNVDQALDLFIQITEALEEAHQAGLIHRDLKPSNIMLASTSTDTEIPKIVDFGIARTVDESVRNKETITKTTEIVGSPLYMSPEQCTGGELDAKSDIYSLGCVMFEAITGQPPFDGSNPVQIILKQISGTAPSLTEKVDSSAKLLELDKVIQKCLAKEKTLRYLSASQLAGDLKKIAAGQRLKINGTSGSVETIGKLTLGFGAFVIIWMLLFAFCIFTPVFYYASHPPEVETAKPETALTTALQAVNSYSNQGRLASELQRVAFYHFRERSYAQALPLLKYVAETNKRTGNLYSEAFCYQCIGQCYLASKNYQESYEWYKKSMDMFSTLPKSAYVPGAETETKTGYIEVLRKLGRQAEADAVQATLKRKDLRNLEDFYRKSGVIEDAARVHDLLERLH